MKQHILFIDPLEKLSLKKDSSLQLALSLKQAGHPTYLLFEQDFYLATRGWEEVWWQVWEFGGHFDHEHFPYLEHLKLSQKQEIKLSDQIILHMRLDPPFDSRYLRYLWMLKSLQHTHGLEVINDPSGILLHNEKLTAYEQAEGVESYVGSSLASFERWVNWQQSKGVEQFILKPLDLYQGIGVEKATLGSSEKSSLRERFMQLVEKYRGPVVVQPFLASVAEGEIRSIWYAGKELGSILKVPKAGDYLANIAQGASYSPIELSPQLSRLCQAACQRLSHYAVPWIAFDLLSGKLSEVNITCPGLLVEVSSAHKRNLALEIVAHYSR